MKNFLAISIIFTVFIASTVSWVKDTRFKDVEEYLKGNQQLNKLERNVENICPGYGHRVEDVLDQSRRCFVLHDDEPETACSLVKKHFSKCIRPIKTMFEECLPNNKSRQLPDLIEKGFLAISNYLCTIDGEHIFELDNECARQENIRTLRCIRRVEVKISEYSKEYPGKHELCTFFKSLRGCLSSHLNYSCGSPLTREAFLGLYDAAISSCDTNEIVDMEHIYPPVKDVEMVVEPER